MQHFEPLESGQFYHVYNRGINSCNIFNEKDNYEYFLTLYDKYLSPVADTFAWVLMPNHFHMLIRVKDEEIGTDSTAQQFSKLFNAYAQAFNKRFNRHGSLFERPFKRKLVSGQTYFRQVVLYIHHNPVHHGFCVHPVEYPWSSYLTCITVQPTHLKRDRVIGWFDNQANFKQLHTNITEVEKIEKWLGLSGDN
jgi:REP element-mobilizing transposase RayT